MKKILLLFLTAGLLAGCGDFLKEQSQSDVIPKSASDFDELLLGAGYPEPGGSPAFNYTSLMEDDVQMRYTERGTTVVGNSAAVIPAPVYQWQPNMAESDGYGKPINGAAGGTVYAGYYDRIKGCNAVLDLIDESIGNREEKDRVKGQALAIRAYYYFWLVNLYGRPYNSEGGPESPGVPLQLTSDLSDDPRPRATVGEIYEEVIVPDLIEAARLMDALPNYGLRRRIGQPAIHIILSRVYLFMERYDDCIAEATKAMEQGVKLMDMINDPRVAGQGPMSGIWGNYQFINEDNPEVVWWYGSHPALGGNTAYRLGGAEEFQRLWTEDGSMPAYPFNIKDRRFAIFNLKIDGFGDIGFITKWTGSNSAQAGSSIRAAEAYLNRAEAYALKGEVGPAYSDIDELRRNRIADANYRLTPDLTGRDLVDAIRLERRKELCFEGHRWFDLRRYGMPRIEHRYGENIVGGNPQDVVEAIYVLEQNDPMYTLPFPNSVIDNNRGNDEFPGMTQNPSANMPIRQPQPEEE